MQKDWQGQGQIRGSNPKKEKEKKRRRKNTKNFATYFVNRAFLRRLS